MSLKDPDKTAGYFECIAILNADVCFRVILQEISNFGESFYLDQTQRMSISGGLKCSWLLIQIKSLLKIGYLL